MSEVKWKIDYIDLRNVGTADSVEVTHFGLILSDSTGTGIVEEKWIDWTPREAIYYQDSATARLVAQSAAFDNWLEIDSDHIDWMKRVQWELKSNLWNTAHDYFDSDGTGDDPVKTVKLTDSTGVVNPLGL